MGTTRKSRREGKMKFGVVILLAVFVVSVSAGAGKHEKETSQVHKLLDGIRDRLLKERDSQESSVTEATTDLKDEQGAKSKLLKEVKKVETKIAQRDAVLKRELEELSATSSRIDQELALIDKIRVMIDHLNGKKVGLLSSHPAENCAQLHALGIRKDGLYWLRPEGWSTSKSYHFFCRFTSSGGYTLVWSNLYKQSESNKASHKLNWDKAVNSFQIVKGGSYSKTINQFTTYTGIGHWKALAPSGKLRYEWARSR